MSHLIVTGVPRTGTQATPPPRLEINTLVANEKQFSLYIQALQRMYATPQTQGASHFQLGGIHGLPFQPWEGAGSRQVAGSRFGGYCTHGTVLFPTWHRPYLAIYEQILHQHAIDIAKTYTVDAAGWNAAAEQLRMPYWDWASNSVPPAQVISMAQVTITAPNGQRTAVQNPLLGYRFNPIDPSFRNTIYSRWPTTLRHPQTSSANATSNVNEMIAWLRSDQDDIRDSTFNLLTRVKTWPAFSNHTTGDGGSASNSIEAIHDGLHVDIGGNGHMSDPSVAAFDPIFFLHHANVDRITALWQAINPDVWVTRGRGAAGTFTLPATTLQDSNTDLTPFWNAAQTFWDSNDSRDTTKLGYIYPEFAGLNLTDKAAVRAAIGAKVNQLYGSGARSNFAFAAAAAPAIAESAAELVGNTPATHAAPPAAMKLFALPARARAPAPPAAEPAQAPVPAHPAAEAEGSTYTDWTARIHVNKYAVGCSFSVLIFIGPVPEDPAQWRTSESYVGAEHVFVNSQAEECENCRNTAEAELEGFVHLNKAIAARSGLNSFDRAVVEPYLKENLAWRILKVDGSTTDNSEVSSLQVIVVATPLSFEEGEVFPHAGTGRHCHEITEGQPGGYHTH